MPNKTPLTEAEWKIIDLLWQKSPRTMTELVNELKEETGWVKNTVITLLKRMQQKGTVTVDESGTVKVYSPNVTREQIAREQTQSLIDRVYGGNPTLMVSHMVEDGEISPKEMQEIMDILRRAL